MPFIERLTKKIDLPSFLSRVYIVKNAINIEDGKHKRLQKMDFFFIHCEHDNL